MFWNFDRRGGRRKGEVPNGSFCPFQVVCIFFFLLSPKQNEVRVRVLSQTRPRHDLRYLFLFSDTFSPTYLPTYYTLFSPFN